MHNQTVFMSLNNLITKEKKSPYVKTVHMYFIDFFSSRVRDAGWLSRPLFPFFPS